MNGTSYVGAAAFAAISFRRSGVIVAARAFPPLLPSSAAALRSGSASSFLTRRDPHHLHGVADHVGGFSPRGPLGIGLLLLGALDAQSLADNLPHGIGLDARALFVSLREAQLGLGDYWFHDQGSDQP